MKKGLNTPNKSTEKPGMKKYDLLLTYLHLTGFDIVTFACAYVTE